MKHSTVKSLLAIIEKPGGKKRSLRLKGKRANLFLQLLESGPKGISRNQGELPLGRLTRQISDLRKKPLDIENITSYAYPIYVLKDKVSEITLHY